MPRSLPYAALAALLLVSGCQPSQSLAVLRVTPLSGDAATSVSTSSVSKSPITGYTIATQDGSPLKAAVGDAVHLKVLAQHADGTSGALPAGALVSWSTPTTVAAKAPAADGAAAPDGDSPVPPRGDQPAGLFIDNQTRYAGSDALGGVLFVIGAGSGANPSLSVKAQVSGVSPAATAQASLALSPMPAGDATRGQALYSANCAACHGATGHGSDQFPGLNNEADHVAGDPDWDAALLAMAARSDMDDQGVALAEPMPQWLVKKSASGRLLSGQDFSDIYAWLKTQNQ